MVPDDPGSTPIVEQLQAKLFIMALDGPGSTPVVGQL